MIFFKLGHLTEKVSMNTSLMSIAFPFLYLRGGSPHKWKIRVSGFNKWLEVLVLDEYFTHSSGMRVRNRSNVVIHASCLYMNCL